jgi:hypothetical protein
VQAHLHWGDPLERDESSHADVDVGKMVTPGTEEYEAFHSKLGVVADYLEELAKAGVPVLWTALHEIDGGWFWWTDAETPENTAALWRQMFDYLVNERGIHNLIWVYQAAHVSHHSRAIIRERHGRAPTLEEEVEYRSRFYPGDDYVDVASTSTYGNQNFYPEWGWDSPWGDTRPSGYELLKRIAPGPGENGMLAVGESYGLVNPTIAQRSGPPWLWCLTWGANTVDWDRFTYNHDHYITLDELPVFTRGNVLPNVRITYPAEGVEAHGSRLYIHGVATDRNGNLESVSVHALSEPWRVWWDLPLGVEYVDAHQPMHEAFGEDTYLGRAELEPDGRWSFTWDDPPTGFHNIVAFTRDAEGAVAASNVVRLSAGITNLARGREATASIHQAPNVAEWAVSNDLNTGWWAGVPKTRRGESVVVGPQWLQVDLGEEKTIGGASIHWWRARATHYTLQVSGDDENWRDVVRVADGQGPMDIHRFDPVRARYVRLHCTEHAVQWQTYCVFDFAVYEELP